MQCYIIHPLSDKLHTASAKLCCTSGDTHSQKGTDKTSFVPAALSSCTFQITVQYRISYIQSTEWNSNSVSKLSDRNIYTNEKPYSNIPGCGTSYKTTLNSQQVYIYIL